MSSGARVDLDGLDNLEARLEHARAGLLDLTEANTAAAKIAAAEAEPYTPRRTGALAGAGTFVAGRDGWSLTNPVRYAPFVHWGTRYMPGRPWLLAGARNAEERWTESYRQHVQDSLDGK